jgi:nitroimidazol reductase NimA-like FMN-containing flavoprotein (pyridoxamine 5'-phosphate oxidase superfamily)
MANKTELTPTSEKNLAAYGLGPIAWDRARVRLENYWKDQEPGRAECPHTHWLSTVRPDGKPHVMPVGFVYYEGAFYFTSGAGTRKSKNLAANSSCVLSIAADGIDLVVEGRAVKLTDEARLQELTKVFGTAGWEPKVENGAFVHDYSAPSAGPPPWDVYEFKPETVFGLATAEPYGATRWRL